jgi:cytochrome c2
MPAKEHFFRDQNKLHLVFAISCVTLLASVLLMMVKDYDDEWRPYQATNLELQAAAKERDIQQMQTAEFKAKRESLEKVQLQIEENLEPFAGLKKELAAQTDEATRSVEALALKLKSRNADRDEDRAGYDLGIRDGAPRAVLDGHKARYAAAQTVCDEIQLELEAAEKTLADIGKPNVETDAEKAKQPGDFGKLTAVELAAQRAAAAAEKAKQLTEFGKLRKESVEIKKSIEQLKADLVLAEDALQKIMPEDNAPMEFKRWLMKQPIIEGFNGQFKVTQDWLPDLHQTLGMTEIARFDRCRTCHMNMDRTAPGNLPAFPHGEPSDKQDVKKWVAENKFPHPYTTHPRHDLFTTASSPHPVGTFGCTACHDGQGSGTSFGNGEHTPNDPHQAEDWHHEYGYHPNHFWEYPMQPERFQESACIKCHHDVTELGEHPKFGASAPKAYKGYNLIRKYGCFGCHEIHGFDGGNAIGPDMRLEPQTAEQEQRIVDDPKQHTGKFRKVGPSLRHVAAKTSADFIAYWTEIPGRFRPTTKMPQFFNLSNQGDEAAQSYQKVELAGIASVLINGSEPIDLLKPEAGYKANAERGKTLFTERGCLACHQHSAVPGTTAEFGPNISDIHKKVNRNKDDNSFSDWLYTWVKEPSRYHARSKMPNLYLDPYKKGDDTIDPAADITAFLLSQGESEQFPQVVLDDVALNDLVKLFLKKSRFSEDAVNQILQTQHFPQSAGDVAGDERVLATEDGAAVDDADEWKNRKIEYIGRRTISRYGCYGCHDIPGYDEARPIGVALQDWGRKDTSKLGLEHIEEFLHHHGEPDGSSTHDRIEAAMAMAEDGTTSAELMEPELTQAFFYDSLLHHGRPGFLWQKLRGPRTYDYMKTETKGYDERLRMPKFPLKEDEIEAIATFVLGLVAEPPAEQYVYTPNVVDKNRIEGEFLLAKYNCTGCHMVELPQVTYGVDIDNDVQPTQLTAADHVDGLKMLLEFRKPRLALTGESRKFKIDGKEVDLPLASFHGIQMVEPDPEEEDPEYRESGFDLWETIDFGNAEDPKRLLPGSRVTIADSKMVDFQPGRGGEFAEWLVGNLVETLTGGNRNLAWQASPPPLIQEGLKVQTAWLYQFLLEPEQLRYTTVLRMPRFNMSKEEAMTLANYFAAVDGAAFPYEEQEPTSTDYLNEKQQTLTAAGLLPEGDTYLGHGWKSVNGTLCVGCHSVGARQYKPSDPKKDIQGPNLNRVQNRLRADWVKLWLYNPKWTTPYTSMPVNFPKNQKPFPDLFGGDAGNLVEGTAAALMNYSKLMEGGPVIYIPTKPDAAPPEQAAKSESDSLVEPDTNENKQVSVTVEAGN